MLKVESRAKGFTLIELITTVVIVAILGSVATPMLQATVQRKKESELKESLRQIRLAIDAYKQASDDGRIKKSVDETGYPPNLEVLVEGAVDLKSPKENKLKFLRRIPRDPMRNVQDSDKLWGLRSYESDADSPVEGSDVYDVYSLSDKIGTNKIPYAKW